MNLSISSFDVVKRYIGMSSELHKWHAVLLAGLLFSAGAARLLLFVVHGPRDNYSHSRLDAVTSNTTAVCLGASHVGMGINPALFDGEVVNFATGALNYEMMEILLGKIIPRAPGLEWGLIELDVFPLKVDTINKLEGDYRPLYKLGCTLEDMPLSTYRKSMQGLQESWFFYPVYFKHRLTPSGFLWDKNDENSADREWDTDWRGYNGTRQIISRHNDGLVVLEYHKADFARDRFKENRQALLRMLAALEREKIFIVLTRLPTHATYWRNKPREWESEYKAVLEDVRRLLPSGSYMYLDYERMSGFADEDFADGHHLNEQGASKLTSMIRNEIKTSMVQIENE